MSTNPTSDIVTERVDDISLLLTQMRQKGIVDLLLDYQVFCALPWDKSQGGGGIN